jgi:ectoine hydroxylase-related dioxygenase (phytanoyl-CoA dioxygenase family)
MQESYRIAGERRAFELGNRGPIGFDANGNLNQHILEAYWRTGFYVFEGLISSAEMSELVAEYESLLPRLPAGSSTSLDSQGRLAVGSEYERPPFRFVSPLTDPHGGTDIANGRYPSKMSEPTPPEDAPEEVLLQINGTLHYLDSALRLYGHPQLLAVAEQINGKDFTPFTDTIWVKPAGLGASVSWHQDGTTQWQAPDLDAGTHGFNFMTNLYETNAENALWVIPETHNIGKIDIQNVVEQNGSDELPDAVPMLCRPGDVAICNRQALHGSFANVSPTTRATFVFGFHRRASVLNAAGWGEIRYDEERVHQRCRIIALAIDARAQHFPEEQPYEYQPLADAAEQNRWSDYSREHLLKNYNLNDLGI